MAIFCKDPKQLPTRWVNYGDRCRQEQELVNCWNKCPWDLSCYQKTGCYCTCIGGFFRLRLRSCPDGDNNFLCPGPGGKVIKRKCFTRLSALAGEGEKEQEQGEKSG